MTDNRHVPRSDWEYALDAADWLVVAHLSWDGQSESVRARQPHVVVMLAAAIYVLAREAALYGQQTVTLRLADVRDRLAAGVRELVVAAPATAGMGLEQREELLADADRLAEAATLAATVVAGLAAGFGVETIEDQLRREQRGAALRRLEQGWDLDL